jgi:hypothetical protein
MALKYGSKSGGFQQRSGNGPLQFKQMGATPAKQIGDYSFTTQDEAKQQDLLKKSQEATLGDNKGKEKIKVSVKDPKTNKRKEIKKESVTKTPEELADIKKEDEITSSDKKESTKKTEEKPQKHQAQIRKQKRLDKITARRKAKGKEGLTSRQIRLQKEVDMSADEFVDYRKEKFQKAMNQLGRVGGIMHPDWDPSKTARYDEMVRTRDLRDQTTRINNEEKASQTKRRNLNIEAYKARETGENKLPAHLSFAGMTKEGDVNMNSTQTSGKGHKTVEEIAAMTSEEHAAFQKEMAENTKR